VWIEVLRYKDPEEESFLGRAFVTRASLENDVQIVAEISKV